MSETEVKISYTDDQVRELNSAVINACNLVNDTLNPERGAE